MSIWTASAVRSSDLLDPCRIKIPIEARDKAAVVRDLARLVPTTVIGGARDADGFPGILPEVESE